MMEPMAPPPAQVPIIWASTWGWEDERDNARGHALEYEHDHVREECSVSTSIIPHLWSRLQHTNSSSDPAGHTDHTQGVTKSGESRRVGEKESRRVGE